MDDAPIAGKQSAMRSRDDIALRRNAVLQRHFAARSLAKVVIPRRVSDEATQTRHSGMVR
jgi:hypothetical protein